MKTLHEIVSATLPGKDDIPTAQLAFARAIVRAVLDEVVRGEVHYENCVTDAAIKGAEGGYNACRHDMLRRIAEVMGEGV